MGTNKVGENIKKLRTESGLSQKEVAQAIGRSESQIGAYENGSVDMPLSVGRGVEDIPSAGQIDDDSDSCKERI